MSSIDTLHRRIDRALLAIEQQREAMQTVTRVVLCDQDGELLPGQKPIEHSTSYIKRIFL